MAENVTFSQDRLKQVSQLPGAVQASDAFLAFASNTNDGGFSFKMLAQNYMSGLENGQINPDLVLGTLVANDFAATKYIAEQNDSGIDQIFMDIITILNRSNDDTSNALAIASPETRQIFDRNDFSYTLPEQEADPASEPEQTLAEEVTPPETQDAAPPTIDAEPPPETEEPNTQSAPPPAGSRGNPIQPRIEMDEPAISYNQIISAVQDIQTQLGALPDDPAERKAALIDISDNLEQMAVTLSPSVAGEGRLGSIPPLTSDWSYEGELQTLNEKIDVILMNEDVSELAEYLVQASHQASIVARDPGALIMPETKPAETKPAEPAPEEPPAEEPPQTQTRLSELLDGRGYHNDTDGYTDYNALEDAFSRAAELGITTEHIENIRVRLNEPDFILKPLRP